MTTIIRNFLQSFTYLALVLMLVASGMGLPLPEDIPLITSGYMCNKNFSPLKAIPNTIDTDNDHIPDQPDPNAKPRHIPHLYLMMIAGMIGVLGGDTIVYFIGRRGVHGKHFLARHLRKVLNSKRRQRVESHFIKHGNLTVFVARFLPGARSIVFAMAGISRMSYARFLLIDGMAAGISVPTFIYIGWRFAEHITGILDWIHHMRNVLSPIAVVLVAGAITLYLVRRRRNRLVDPLQTNIARDIRKSEPIV